MKRSFSNIALLALFSLFASTLSGQVYTPLDLSEGATWSHTECGYKPDWGAVYKFKIYGDTVVNDNIYKKIYYQYRRGEAICANCDFTFNRDSASLFAFIRQIIPKKKIYFIYPGHSDKEWLGYDFDITSVGQTVAGFSLIFTTEPEAPTVSIYVYQLEVDEIDSICVDGTYRRRYFYGAGNGGNIYHLPEHWVEGVGSTHGLLVQGFGGPDWEHSLYCFHNKEGSVYYDTAAILDCVLSSSLSCSEGTPCSPITGLEITDPADPIHVYPNPVKDQLIVECKIPDSKLELTFFNRMGQKVCTKLLIHPDEVSVVSLNDLPSGFYYVTIQAGDFYTGKKIIKE